MVATSPAEPTEGPGVDSDTAAQPLLSSPKSAVLPKEATSTVSAATAPSEESGESPPPLPACWGHRGASAAYPENTLASFEAAIRDGAEGIESDPRLGRTTNGSGKIEDQAYHGVLDQLLTKKAPHQKIPTFSETLALLKLPENSHVVFCIDVKMTNNPKHLFTLMHDIISTHENYETALAPRLVLGLWHPKFLKPAQEILPYIRLTHIGVSIELAKLYFWDSCGAFSMLFSVLVGSEGEAFRAECKAAGKDVYVWTVNKRPQMIEAAKWGVHAILTDRPAEVLSLRKEMESNWAAVAAETTWRFKWSSLWYYSFASVSPAVSVMPSHEVYF
ncbi:hypothetical protein RQP46_001781 [Phenoliferia psychrophenolica]